MRKNFTLTKDTADLLVQRIEKAISNRGSIKLDHFYTGVQGQHGYLKSVIPDSDWSFYGIVRSRTSIISRGDYVIENDKEMQGVRINWGRYSYSDYGYESGNFINYGTKMNVHSGKIEYKEQVKYLGNGGVLTVFTL